MDAKGEYVYESANFVYVFFSLLDAKSSLFSRIWSKFLGLYTLRFLPRFCVTSLIFRKCDTREKEKLEFLERILHVYILQLVFSLEKLDLTAWQLEFLSGGTDTKPTKVLQMKCFISMFYFWTNHSIRLCLIRYLSFWRSK